LARHLPRGDYLLINGQDETLMEAQDFYPDQGVIGDFDAKKPDGVINMTVRRD